MNTTWQKWSFLIGRIALSTIFLISGVSKILNWSGTSKYMASKGLPMIPLLLTAAIIFEIAGALSVMLGYRARIGAILLAIFIIVVTPIFHNFWALSGQARFLQRIMFLKNLSILGGLLLIIGSGSGELSLDSSLSQKRENTDT